MKLLPLRMGFEKYLDAIDTPNDWAKLGFLKAGIDGGILTGTSYMRRPYGEKGGMFGIDDAHFRGVLRLSKEQLTEYIKMAGKMGLQMAAHCVGDAACDVFISAYDEVDRIDPIDKKRFTIIHADFTDDDMLKKVKELGLILISQPAWHYMDGTIINRILDRDIMKTFLPYKKMDELDIKVCAGSDHMVKHDSLLSHNPYNPFAAMYNMVTRKTRKGDLVEPGQRISREKALRMYTIDSAYASFDESIKGSLEKGKLADLAVLTGDYLACPEEEIPFIEAELTMTGGRIVYSLDPQ